MAPKERTPVTVSLATPVAAPPATAAAAAYEPGKPSPPVTGPAFEAVSRPVESLDLEDLGLDITIGREQVQAILEERMAGVTQVFATIGHVSKDLDHYRPTVPATLPTTLTGTVLNADGSPAASVRLSVLEPDATFTTGDKRTYAFDGGWPNPQVITDVRGGFRIAVPAAPVPDTGLTLRLAGGNATAELTLARKDLVAGDGRLGILTLDATLVPLPRSVLAQLGDIVRPTSEADLIEHPDLFAEPAPVITLGDGDCGLAFRSNSGVIDRFQYSMLVRLIAPELSGRRLGSRISVRDKAYRLSASTAGLTKYLAAGDLIEAMGSLGTWELTSRIPVENPIDVGSFLDAVQRDPRRVPKAATLGIGYVVKMHQIWIPNGLSLGDLVYSLPLAPGEQQRIAVADSRETLTVREQESMSADEAQSYNERADSSTDAVFSSAFNESARGGSTMKTRTEAGSFGGGLGIGGFFSGIVAGLGLAGGYSDSTTTGSASSWQTASRDYVSNASQDFHSNLSRSAAARRNASRTSVRLATATETKEVVTKVITNHNHNHALTMQYWEVLRHFSVTSQLDDVQLVCFVPLEVVAFIPPDVPRVLPSGSYTRDSLLHRYAALLRHADVISSRTWWSPQYRHAMRVLKAFAGNPTMGTQSLGGAPQDIVTVTLKGSFLPFEDVYVTAVANDGARIGPVRMTGTSPSVAAGATTKAQLIEQLRSVRANTSAVQARVAALPLPEYMSRSNIARFEFTRGFRPFSYQLSLPTGLSFTDLIAYLGNAGALSVTMQPDELERELSGPLVADPTATIPSYGDILEPYNGPGGFDVMPVSLPVAAKRIPPQLAFADVLRIEELLGHVVENTVELSKAVWQSLTAEERAIMLEQYTIGVPSGGLSDATDEVPLLNCVANQVLGYFGNAAIMPFFIPPDVAKRVGYTSRDVQESLLRFHKQAYRPALSSITLPARGVLGEAVLGHCESSEKIDLTRFWNWQDSPPDQATDPATLSTLFADANPLIGSAGAQAPNTLTPNAASMVTINSGPTAMTPAGLGQALIQGQPASNLPQDLTGITQLGAQMKTQTETTADTLNKTITEASSLAKEAMKQVPEAIKAKQAGTGSGSGGTGSGSGTGGSGTGSGSGTGGSGTGGSGSTGTGSGSPGSSGTGSSGAGSTGGSSGGADTTVASVDGGAAPVA